MARVTKALTQGLKMVGGSNVSNYSLHFLSPTKKHEAGGFMTVVVPHITLGRGPNCQVRYGEGFSTVSRNHAEIEHVGKDIVIKNLSQTNSTIVNGTPIAQQWFLNNGDEIQLSKSGPKIRFNATPTRTSNIKFTARMQMFAQQALRPYKQAVWALSILLGLSLLFGGYNLYNNIQTKKELEETAIANKKQLEQLEEENNKQIAKVKKDAEDAAKKSAARESNARKRIKELEEKVSVFDFKPAPPPPTVAHSSSSGSSSSAISRSVSKLPVDQVYFVFCLKIEVPIDGQMREVEPEGSPYLWSGTGFMTSDKKFVTARHVIQGWRYFWNSSDDMLAINALESSGAKIKAYFGALSKSGDSFTFTSDEIQLDESRDQNQDIGIGSIKTAVDPTTDWAYMTMEGKNSPIGYDRELAKNLKMGDKLKVLGFSYGLATQPTKGDLSPLYSEVIVAQDGLTKGVINTTHRGFGQGNSGGPVFYEKNGKFVIVGIVSAGIGSEIGIIVPISAIR